MEIPTRDTRYVKQYLVEENSKVSCSKECNIYILKEFKDAKLVTIGNAVSSIGLFAIEVDNKYLTIRSPLTYQLNFSKLTEVTIDDKIYLKLIVDKGMPIFSTSVVRSVFSTVALFTFIGLRGKVPFYATKNTIAKILYGSSKYAGIKLDKDPGVLQLMMSLAQRSKDNIEDYHRHVPNSEIQYVPLTDITFGSTSNFNRLLGGYQAAGTVTSLVSDGADPKPVEQILRR